MGNLSQIFTRGINFVRNNPQIIYTLFLVVGIPVAFFFTNEQFSKIARDNQNRLEYSRIGFLHDGFVLFARDHMSEPNVLAGGITKVASENTTMVGFRVLGPIASTSPDGSRTYPIIASMDASEEGGSFAVEHSTEISFNNASVNFQSTYSTPLLSANGRYWQSVRGIPGTTSPHAIGYVITDLAMADADAISQRRIRDAYAVSGLIILCIIILLARQARIIDYATLYARLKEVDQMKDDFVSMAAHELRSPLTVIRGYVEMVSEVAGLPDKSKEHLKNIDAAATRLNLLIGDILDVAKLQEGRMSFNFQSIDVSGEIETIVESYRKPALDKGLQIHYNKTPLPLISVDVDRFRQVFINLVGNAVKYTPSGEVRVSASAVGAQLQIRVSDTGMGISAEDQQKLFQKFFRVKNEETKAITGTGLGLWITTSMVKSMKGTISVESIKGKGTDFILDFPIVK